MKSTNKAIRLGAVSQASEVRFSQQGLYITSCSLVTGRERKDKDKVMQWHNCAAFEKRGESYHWSYDYAY